MAIDKEAYFSETFKECFEDYLQEKKAAASSRAEYTRRIHYITSWYGKDFLSITASEAQDYVEYLKTCYYNKSLSRRTIYIRVNFYYNLADHICRHFPELAYKNAFRGITLPTLPDDSLTYHQIPPSDAIDKILSKASSEMLYLILALVFRVALSLSEVLSLSLNNIVESDGQIFLHFQEKNGMPERLVGLPDDVAKILSNYISSMNKTDDKGHLFYNKYGNPLTRQNLYKQLTPILRECGFNENYTMRDFRSRSILDMIVSSKEKGAEVSDVADYVGIHDRRLRTYIKNSHIIKNIPANLVNIEIKPYSDANR